MGIVVVFFVGLAKLWATNRHMRRLEALDAEKQARATQMRKSGLSPPPPAQSAASRFRPGAAIPFGVKALEAGVEVEGVWVARMASMASRPPERKWNSRRKVRAGVGGGVEGSRPPAPSSVEMNDMGGGGPSKRAWRGPRRGGMISRQQIIEPSVGTRDKLEYSSLLEEEEERRSRDLTGRGAESKSLAAGATDDEQPRISNHGSRGALGKLQRGLKKMTSTETWQDQKKHHAGGGRLDAKEFHEGAQAKKPQRFYPTSPPRKAATTTTTAPPLPTPRARSQANRQVTTNLYATRRLTPLDDAPAITTQDGSRPHHAADPRSQSFAVRRANALQQQPPQRTSTGSASSADSFVTTTEEPVSRDHPRPPRRPHPHQQQPHTRTSSSGGSGDDDGARGARGRRPDISPRRSSLRHSQSRGERPSSGERGDGLDRTGDAAAAAAAQVAVPVARYPPNSSRSAPTTTARRRSSSSAKQEQDQQQQIGSMPPTLGVGPGQV